MDKNKYSNFLASFFPDKTKYAEVEINNFVIIQQIHGVSLKPIYALYTKESFLRYKEFTQNQII